MAQISALMEWADIWRREGERGDATDKIVFCLEEAAINAADLFGESDAVREQITRKIEESGSPRFVLHQAQDAALSYRDQVREG